MKRILLSLAMMVFAIVFLVQTTSMASQQGYAGPAKPADETALLKSGAYTEIVSVDGTKVSSLNVTVLPGEHTLVMKPSYPVDGNYATPYFFYSVVNGSVTFKADAGHTYVAYARTSAGQSTENQSAAGYASMEDQTGSGFTWVGYIEDKTDHERVAKTETLALQAYPRTWGYGGSAFTHH